MDELKFFNNRSNLFTKIALCLVFACMMWFWFAIFAKEDLDPFYKTIAISIVFFFTLFVIYSAIEVNEFFVDYDYKRVGNKKGVRFFNKTYFYHFDDIRHVDLRIASSTHHSSSDQLNSSSASVCTTYYAVLVMEEEEIYIPGSSDEAETKQHTKQLAQNIGKSYYVNFNKSPKLTKRDFNFVRVLALLTGVLASMYGLFLFLS